MSALAIALLALGVAAAAEAPRQDPWTVAREAPDGPERTAALVAALAPAALEGLAPEARLARLEVAYRAFLGAEERCAAAELLALAEAMAAADPAPWSVFCLEGALRRGFGRYADADAALAALERATSDRAVRRAVIERRALVAAGAGWASQEAALLGRALAEGSPDARQILGFAALCAGRAEEASAHFGALLVDAAREGRAPGAGVAARDLPPWALRGHGLALLPTQVSPAPRR